MSEPSAVIVGGGLAGLLLAIALKKKLGITASVYEQAQRFDDEVGGAIGMYPNGLAVVREISPVLLRRIRTCAVPFQFRRWMRHDGSEVALASEHFLCQWETPQDEEERSSIGIRRWRLQKVLMEYCAEEGIPVTFNERVTRIENVDPKPNEQVKITFESGKTISTDLVFGCDGAKSAVRGSLFGTNSDMEPAYTGITCLMGAASIPRSKPGICFPSSKTTRCHAVFYPTGPAEQIFQIYFPIMPERPETWRPLSEEEGRFECEALANKLKSDGWASEFVEPLLRAKNVIRVGLRARTPISCWHKGRVVLLGDAAHPPVPYIGQGAMQAFEDVGVLSLLMQQVCRPSASKPFNFGELKSVFQVYEKIRIPRTSLIYESSHALGRMQLLRAHDPSYIETKKMEWDLWWQIKRNGTLPTLWAGSNYDFRKEVKRFLEKYRLDAKASKAEEPQKVVQSKL